MRRTIIALVLTFCTIVAADTNNVMIFIPFVGTNSTRTNLPAWWDDGTNRTGVSPWQFAQAVNENFTRHSNLLAGVSGHLVNSPTNSLAKWEPLTIPDATNTTWGYGGGLMCMDSNYVYVSVGTNAWKRTPLSAW